MTSPPSVLLNDVNSPVVLREQRTASQHKIGLATLNSEPTLNSLSLEMIGIISNQLDRWSEDEELVCVFLEGAGERAFAAGGDIQALYRAMTRSHEEARNVGAYAEEFFEAEYRLDHQLHTYPKPVLAWGNGVVMGGGLGVFSAAGIRVVTENSRIAMPEITIGLFPDAGATHLLGNLPRHQALFLALTASHMNAGDAMALELATHFVAQAKKSAVLEAMTHIEWLAQPRRDAELIGEQLNELVGVATLPASQMRAHDDIIRDALADCDEPIEIGSALRGLAGSHPWIDRGLETFSRGCPTSAGIIVEQIRRAGQLDLEQGLRLELVIATHCARNTDFAEGIRALIIDKDNRPRWRFASLEELPWTWVLEHFEPPWRVNPLSDLWPATVATTQRHTS